MVFESDNGEPIDVENSVADAIQKLKNEYEVWQNHQRDSDNMLYVLLENCLDFYYFLRQNERYESAFKNTCEFKWNAKSKITQLIAKSIFGDNKRASVYARAIEIAALKKIGGDGQQSMLAWLQSNGGVNGVIRSENPNKSASAAMKDKEEMVGRNAEKYGVLCNIQPIINEQFKRFPSGDWIFLCSVSEATGEIKLKWFTQNESLVNSAFAELGSHVMTTNSYKKRHLAVEAETAVERAEAHGVVGEELQKILEKIKNRRVESSSK